METIGVGMAQGCVPPRLRAYLRIVSAIARKKMQRADALQRALPALLFGPRQAASLSRPSV